MYLQIVIGDLKKKRGILKYFESARFLFLLLGGHIEERKGTMYQTKRSDRMAV